MLQRRIELCGDAPRAPLQPCKRRVRPPTGGPPAQGRSTPEQAQSEKSQGVRGTESPDPSITDQRNRELRVRFFGGTTRLLLVRAAQRGLASPGRADLAPNTRPLSVRAAHGLASPGRPDLAPNTQPLRV